MKECLQAIFTNEQGEQKTIDYPLETMGAALKNFQTIEDYLLLDYSTHRAKRTPGGAIAAGHWLIKLSIAIYSEEPEKWAYLFADGWDGNFTYDPKLIN